MLNRPRAASEAVTSTRPLRITHAVAFLSSPACRPISRGARLGG
jgi:hypothetical protein